MYMSVDGGGTKIYALLFDDDGNRRGFGQGGSVNPNFTPHDLVRKNMLTTIESCFSDVTPAVIESLYISMAGSSTLFQELLSKILKIQSITIMSEGYMGLLSGILADTGFTALSGTGSDAFFSSPKATDSVGGWGSLLGDEGSGFDIGRQALAAACRAHDGWGEPTVLTEKIPVYYGISRLIDLVPLIYHNPEYRTVISKAARVTSEAASEGDSVALGIYRRAGMELAAQVLALTRRWDEPCAYPVTICGGAWKGHAEMFKAFTKEILTHEPQRRIYFPKYEPVAGGLVRLFLETGRNPHEVLTAHYSDMRHPLPPCWQ